MNSRTHLFLVSYATAAFGSLFIVFAAYAYAKSHDPWLTPRFSHSMIFLWKVSATFKGFASLGMLVGLLSATTVRELRRSWLMWLSIVAFVLADIFGYP